MSIVLGADPDAEVTPWLDAADEYVPTVYASPPVRRLINHFAYHKDMKMSQRCNEQDKGMIGKLLSRRLKQGYTAESLTKMIDRFFQSWASEYDAPAYAFVSNKIQDQLLQEAEVVKNDPVLEWLLMGMPNTPLYLEPTEVRRAVLQASPDLTHRYPEYLADAIREDDTYIGMRDKIDRAFRKVSRIPESQRRPMKDTMALAIGAIPL